MDAGRAVSFLIQQDQELANMICADLADIQDVKVRTEAGEGIELLGIKFKRAAGQVARAAGVQVDADPFPQIVALVYIQSKELVLRDNRFHMVDHQLPFNSMIFILPGQFQTGGVSVHKIIRIKQGISARCR